MDFYMFCVLACFGFQGFSIWGLEASKLVAAQLGGVSVEVPLAARMGGARCR